MIYIILVALISLFTLIMSLYQHILHKLYHFDDQFNINFVIAMTYFTLILSLQRLCLHFFCHPNGISHMKNLIV